MSISNMASYMISGIGITFQLVPLCMITTFAIGLILGVIQFKRVPGVKLILNIYNVVMRGVPALVILKLLYYSANFASAFVAALMGLTLYHAAYVGEIVRGCFESVPKGQMMAGESLGVSYWKIMFRIYIPQIFKQMVPALCGQYILLVKDTTLVYIVGVQDIMWMGRQLMAQTFNPIAGYLLIGVFYYVLCALIELLAHRVEKKTSLTTVARSLRAYY